MRHRRLFIDADVTISIRVGSDDWVRVDSSVPQKVPK